MANEPEIDLRNLLRNRLTFPVSTKIVDNWPYFTNLVYGDFPRISIVNQFDSSKPYGIGSNDTLNTARLQIDIWVKPDNLATIGSGVYEGFNEVRKISRDVTEAIRKYWRSDMATTAQVIYEVSLNWYSPKIDYDQNIVRRTGDISFVILRTG